ncbi:MAG TPA: hypothetical protein VFT79_03495 [Solirubrobacterales bacterium]|nr:hypothetical protein [Solirubrobacterales bacterium]
MHLGLPVAVAALAIAVVFASAALASAGPSSFRHDVRRIDAHFRVGIEYAPVDLGEGLSASEIVCGLAEQNEQQGDAAGANANWTTLSQLVDEVDRPAMAKVEGALQRADTGLRELRERYSGGWSDPAKVAKLNRGVARARRGVRSLTAAMETIAGSFEAWSARQCQAATNSIVAGIARVPAAVGRINAGMQLLWELAFPLPPTGPARDLRRQAVGGQARDFEGAENLVGGIGPQRR